MYTLILQSTINTQTGEKKESAWDRKKGSTVEAKATPLRAYLMTTAIATKTMII